MVKQNIVFVENTPGSLQKVTKILAENQIDIYGFGCFDAPEFANFRMVCDNPERADEIMAEHGYMTRITQAILVDLQDEIGGLDKLLSVMGDSNVNLHYIYTFFHRGLKVPVAIMHCEDLLVAESVLRNNGFQVLNRLVDPDGEAASFSRSAGSRNRPILPDQDCPCQRQPYSKTPLSRLFSPVKTLKKMRQILRVDPRSLIFYRNLRIKRIFSP